MDLKNLFTLPFLVRQMLSYEHATAFQLRIISRSSNGGVVLLRGTTREGMFTYSHTLVADNTTQTQNFRITDLPIFLSVIDRDGNIPPGDAYVAVQLMINGDVLAELASGQVFRQKAITYPGADNRSRFNDRGQFLAVTGSNPAAGSEASITVPDGVTWRVINARIQLVTDGNAANRRPHIIFKSSTNLAIDCFNDVDITASLTRNLTIANFGAIPDTADDNDILIPMPGEVWMETAETAATVTTNLQATDNYGQLFLYVEQFFN